MSTLEPISPHLKAAQLGYFPLGVCQNLDITANRAQTKIAPQQICTFAKGGNSTCQGNSRLPKPRPTNLWHCDFLLMNAAESKLA